MLTATRHIFLRSQGTAFTNRKIFIKAFLRGPSHIRTMAAATQDSSYHFILKYDYVEGIAEKRKPFREQHLSQAKSLAASGKLVLGGAVGDPVEGAIFIFKDLPKAEIEEFVKRDPYIQNSLVPKWSIEPYNVVVSSL